MRVSGGGVWRRAGRLWWARAYEHALCHAGLAENHSRSVSARTRRSRNASHSDPLDPFRPVQSGSGGSDKFYGDVTIPSPKHFGDGVCMVEGRWSRRMVDARPGMALAIRSLELG